jgi:AraC family transcriptional activator of pobA
MSAILSMPVQQYSIRDIIDYRALPWAASEEFLFLTEIPLKFEPFAVESTYYSFGMITEGSLEIAINGCCHKLSANSLLVYRPGESFKIQAIAAETRGAFVLFTRRFLDYLDENIFSVKAHSFLSKGRPSLVELTPTHRDHLLRTFREIFALLQHLSTRDWELIARNLTSALVYETDTILKECDQPLPAGTAASNHLFDSFMQQVRQHFQAHRNVSFYADLLSVSPDHLHAVVKSVSGKTPTTLIQHQVMRHAKYLLAGTPANVSEVAYQLHFSDPFAFSKFFKKHAGCAPSQYREQATGAALQPAADLDR